MEKRCAAGGKQKPSKQKSSLISSDLEWHGLQLHRLRHCLQQSPKDHCNLTHSGRHPPLLPPPPFPFYFPFSTLPFRISSLPHRSLLISPIPRCSPSNLTSSDGLFNYSSFHFCLFGGNPFLSVPFLTLILLFQFYILVKTAQDRFSVVVTKLSTHLKLSPSMGAVTLLALGNGAPDVFASVAAVRGGQPRTGFGAILSAGTFVSAFVVGFVAIYAAPFAVDPAPFVRDVLFYLTAALFLFYVYLSAEIFLWQAVGFVGFYIFFVGIVFSMDLGYSGISEEKGKSSGGGGEVGLVENWEKRVQKGLEMDCENGEISGRLEVETKQVLGSGKHLQRCLKPSVVQFDLSSFWEIEYTLDWLSAHSYNLSVQWSIGFNPAWDMCLLALVSSVVEGALRCAPRAMGDLWRWPSRLGAIRPVAL
ncbi:Cation/calcium exchanger 5 [Sesamum angolense]|uniref:Cation/calcium exchanger 5 n=1 Tax=Sesamum angolense TaxID=2727404 RepID=A0AAE2C2I8_9LAMI|nr:Cation/calcium exchanger 5 [Sesamum angolense]